MTRSRWFLCEICHKYIPRECYCKRKVLNESTINRVKTQPLNNKILYRLNRLTLNTQPDPGRCRATYWLRNSFTRIILNVSKHGVHSSTILISYHGILHSNYACTSSVVPIYVCSCDKCQHDHACVVLTGRSSQCSSKWRLLGHQRLKTMFFLYITRPIYIY